ncbi:hypothetical protein FVEG_15120 [Fusarium verticillioides 7600]|uniref:Uncharacterized protein n=1 Tax=Gibberella moniliformis (strain M3125 / FGSC 7600) TaxID=334819 RepID=W7LP18_GIBM7|nr:hypothetical protein FVEG_15120 [Fusarium verticillioides 7600]EWG40231.1 hypothetical protein FVEG_15120 [Fusarium verticillioides 7600]
MRQTRTLYLSVHPSIHHPYQPTRTIKVLSTESLRPEIPPCFPINYLHFLFHSSLQLVLSLALAYRLQVCRAFSILRVRPFICNSTLALHSSRTIDPSGALTLSLGAFQLSPWAARLAG